MFKNQTIRSRLITTIGMLSALIIGGAVVGFTALSMTSNALHTVYEDRMQPSNMINRILSLMNENRMQIALVAQHDPANPFTSQMHDHPVDEHIDEMKKNRDQITAIWDAFMQHNMTDRERELAEKYAESRKRYVVEGLQQAAEAAKAGEFERVSVILISEINPYYEEARDDAEALLAETLAVAKADYDAAAQRYHLILLFGIVGMTVGILIAVWMGMTLLRTIVSRLNNTTQIFDRIAAGSYDNEITIGCQDEIGRVLESLKGMQGKLAHAVSEARRVADESLRVKIALDNVGANVMMADVDRKIIYVNKAVESMFRNAERDIRTQLPSFDANRLLGSNIDNFHKNPGHQAQLLASFTSTYRSTLSIGGRTMTVVANPVINEQGQRLGAVVEWADRTNEVAVEREVSDLVNAAAAGDFSQRIAVQGKAGFYLQLAEGINQVVEASERGINDVASVLKALAEGDLTQRMEGDYAGLFAELRDHANSTSERLKEIVGQIREGTDAINTASNEIASGNTDLSSRTENQASSLEETTASMDELTSTVKQNADNARQANQLAKGASDIAERGGNVVGEVVITMGGIAESSKKIADIISVIDGIAFQTNILALNAAVEAARAGEQGRGFAVVAGEVRSLAGRSAAAAKEIKELISTSVDRVNDGYKLVETAGKTMSEVVDAVRRVTDIMGEITAASVEQSQGIEKVNLSITQMDEMTQQNAALVEQAAAAAESLQEQAASLVSAVSVFKLAEGRGRVLTASRPAARNAAPRPSVRTTRNVPAPTSAGDDEWAEF